MLGLAQLPFSLLLTSTILTPIARLCALACFLDIALLCGLRNRPQPTPQHPFQLYNLIATFIAHFSDAKAFHYFPVLLRAEDNVVAAFCFGCYLALRIVILVFCLPLMWIPLEEKVQRRGGKRVEGREECISGKPKVWMAVWIVVIGSGWGVLLGVAAWFCGYNLVTVQFPWLLELIFTGRGGFIEESKAFFKVYNATE